MTLALALLLAAAPAEPPAPVKRPLREYVSTLAKKGKKPFIVAPGLKTQVLASLDDEKWTQHLGVLAELFSLEVSELEQALRVTDRLTYPGLTAFQLKGPDVQSIKLKWLLPDADVLAILRAMFPETLFSVREGKTVLAGGTTAAVTRARQVIESLDVEAGRNPKADEGELAPPAAPRGPERLAWYQPPCDVPGALGGDFRLKGRMTLGQAVARTLAEGRRSYVVEPVPYFDEEIDVDLRGSWTCVLKEVVTTSRVQLVLLRDVVLAREVLVSRFGEPAASSDELESRVFPVRADSLEFVEEHVRRSIRKGLAKSIKARSWIFVRASKEDLARLTPVVESFAR